ncbi:hypothetical protein A2U01_0099398, partial [Trifolium medium]|nr:hypothetical protein [Trifolium medium]
MDGGELNTTAVDAHTRLQSSVVAAP